MGTPGRPPNFVLQRRLAHAILGKEGTPEYEEYVKAQRRLLLAGILPPNIHQLLLYYAVGKPTEQIEVGVTVNDTLAHLTEDELRDKARRIAMAQFILAPATEAEIIESESVEQKKIA